MYSVYIRMKCIVKNTTIQFCVWRWCCHIQTFWSASSITSTCGSGVSVCEPETALFPGISLLHPYVSRNSGLPWQRLPLHSGMGEVDLSHLLKRERLFTTGQFPGTPGPWRGWWGADAWRCLKTWLTGFTCAHQDGVVCVCTYDLYTIIIQGHCCKYTFNVQTVSRLNVITCDCIHCVYCGIKSQ